MIQDYGTLYIVATPIGNLDDMSKRAIKTLLQVDLIAAEDTRHSKRLLQRYAISTPMMTVHDYNESAQVKKLLSFLQKGKSVALISDAGTPLISDPGYRLVRMVRQKGINVVPIPGSCAAIAALCASGLASNSFIFEGFLSVKQHARLERLKSLKDETRTLIFYEAPHRIIAMLKDMSDVFGEDRYVVVARELTKLFETIRGDCLSDLVKWIESNTEQQCGEFVVLVEGVQKASLSELTEEDHRILKILLQELSVKQAAHLAAKITGKKKNLLYQQAIM